MTTYTSYFKAGQHPGSYLPGSTATLNDDLGGLLNLWDLESVSRKDDTFTARMTNGLQLKLSGSDFSYDDGLFSGGTIKDLRILTSDGKSTLARQEGLKLDAADFFTKAVSTYEVQMIYGGPIDRTAYVFDGYDFVDWLRDGDDTLKGSDGAEDLFGGGGDDRITGGGGDDLLGGGSGKDFIDGGKGFDMLYFGGDRDPDSRHGITLDTARRTVIDPWGNKERFAGIESFEGTAYADRMTGSDANETFRGRNGRDTIDGKGGIDEARYDFDFDPRLDNARGVTVDLGKGSAVDGFGQKDRLLGIENAYGSSGEDVIIGSNGANVLGGGFGADTLTGGGGRDVFLFDTTIYYFDRITDFDAKADAFRLDNDVYFLNLATTGSGSARRLADKAFTVGDPGEDWSRDTRILYDKAKGDVYYDRDGSGDKYGADIFAHLDKSPTLTAAHFLVV